MFCHTIIIFRGTFYHKSLSLSSAISLNSGQIVKLLYNYTNVAITPFAQLILDTIRERDMTLRRAAIEMNVTQQSLSRWLAGQSVPTTASLLKVAEFVNRPVAELLTLLGTKGVTQDDPRRDRLLYYFDNMPESDREIILREARALYDLGESEDRAARVG